MGTEVLLPSKALVAAKVTLSLYPQPVIIPNGPEEENKNLGFGKNNQRVAPSPRGQRGGGGQPQSTCGCSCWRGFWGTQYSVSVPAWGDKDRPGLPFRLCSHHPMAPL